MRGRLYFSLNISLQACTLAFPRRSLPVPTPLSHWLRAQSDSSSCWFPTPFSSPLALEVSSPGPADRGQESQVQAHQSDTHTEEGGLQSHAEGGRVAGMSQWRGTGKESLRVEEQLVHFCWKTCWGGATCCWRVPGVKRGWITSPLPSLRGLSTFCI